MKNLCCVAFKSEKCQMCLFQNELLTFARYNCIEKQRRKEKQQQQQMLLQYINRNLK